MIPVKFFHRLTLAVMLQYNTNMETCTICKSELIDEKVHFHSKSYNEDGEKESDIVIYEAWCPNCEIYLTKSTYGRKQESWKTSNLELKDIGEELSNEDFETLKNTIESLDVENDNFFLVKSIWDRFIVMKKTTDKIYLYKNSFEKGYVIIRGNNRIGKFPDLLNILE